MNLTELNLYKNKLRNLIKLFRAFSNLTVPLVNFNRLNIEANLIENLDADFPISVENITKLSLGLNNFSSLPSTLFRNLLSLQNLDLNNNRAFEFQQSYFTWPGKLLILNLNYNSGLKTINNGEIFNGLENLETLNFYYGAVESFNISVRSFGSLKVLILNNNRMRVFQMERDLGSNVAFKIEKLNLSCNRLEMITPKMFAQFDNLINMELSNNAIRYIERRSFYSLTKLKMLLLSDNLITRIKPFTFSILKLREVISINGNLIGHISNETFHGLETVDYMKLFNNKLETVGTFSFAHFKSLTSKALELQEQRMYLIESFAFFGLNLPDILKLSFNRLNSLRNNTFLGLERLRTLNLDNNLIQSIEPLAFNGLGKLDEL